MVQCKIGINTVITDAVYIWDTKGATLQDSIMSNGKLISETY